MKTYTLDEIKEKAKKESFLYHALEKVIEKHENGKSDIDNLKEVTYSVDTMQPIKTSPEMKEAYENDEAFIKKALENWLEIPILATMRDMEKETLSLIIYYMNEEQKTTLK